MCFPQKEQPVKFESMDEEQIKSMATIYKKQLVDHFQDIKNVSIKLQKKYV